MVSQSSITTETHRSDNISSIFKLLEWALRQPYFKDWNEGGLIQVCLRAAQQGALLVIYNAADEVVGIVIAEPQPDKHILWVNDLVAEDSRVFVEAYKRYKRDFPGYRLEYTRASKSDPSSARPGHHSYSPEQVARLATKLEHYGHHN